MKVRIGLHETKETRANLERMPFVLRGKLLQKALRKGGNVVAREARRLCPKPGYPGDDPTKKPLNKTITTVWRQYGSTVMTVTGPRYAKKDGGNHGHLVEFGHSKVLWGTETGGRVQGKPFMRPAADTTKAKQESEIINHLRSSLAELVK